MLRSAEHTRHRTLQSLAGDVLDHVPGLAQAREQRALRGRPGRIAIAHDYLTQRGGAERVVLALHRMYPDAPIYTTFYDPEATFPEFRDATIITSPLNAIRPLRRDPRAALPLLPLAASLMRVREPLAVISSSGWAHGFRCAGRSLVYCHTPARWVYFLEQYLGGPWWGSPRGVVGRVMNPMLRRWDARAAGERDRYIGNSSVIVERIRKVYGMRDVAKVFPPHSVDVDGELEPIPGLEHLADGRGFLLNVSRLMPYKNADRAIRAAEQTGQRMLVIGRGPQRAELQELAGPGIAFAQDITDAQLRWAYAHATMLVAASYEDFGITPLEASAWGLPTVALNSGGYLDTIVPGLNGVRVNESTVEALADGIRTVLASDWDAEAIRAHAAAFSEAGFARRIREEMDLLASRP